MTNLTASDFHLDLPVAASAERLRAAVADVGAWWSTAIEHDGDEFTVRFAENWTRARVSDGGARWTITAQDTPGIPVPDEWVGDELRFDVEDAGDGTSVLHFTHLGLRVQECVDLCVRGWTQYTASLVALAETGEGRPWVPAAAPVG